jgi:hypothetical protein
MRSLAICMQQIEAIGYSRPHWHHGGATAFVVCRGLSSRGHVGDTRRHSRDGVWCFFVDAAATMRGAPHFRNSALLGSLLGRELNTIPVHVWYRFGVVLVQNTAAVCKTGRGALVFGDYRPLMVADLQSRGVSARSSCCMRRSSC